MKNCLFNLRSPFRYSLWSTLFIVAFNLLSTQASAQCDLACIGTLEAPLHVVLNNDCEIGLTSEMVVRDDVVCPGPKLLTVRDSLNNFVAEGVDFAPFSGGDYINRRLSVSITDQNTGIVCVGFIRVFDNTIPTVTNCPTQTLTCLDDTNPESVGYPAVVDNCDTELDFSYVDTYTNADCLTDTAAYIMRDWTISDDLGVSVNCTQRINILRASSMEITFPADVQLSCDAPDADPTITGKPLLDGHMPMHGDMCGLSVGVVEDTIFICNDYMYRIERTWTVIEECTNFFEEYTQVITVSDSEGPSLNCPTTEALTFGSSEADCGATIALPIINGTDNCSADITYSVSSSYGATDFSPVSNVAPGLHTVTYQGMDECGNISTCTVGLRVIDDVAPIAACDDQVVISIPSGGYGIILANTFDEGSSDNCASPVFFKVKRNQAAACDGANGDDSDATGYQEWFDDRVIFCCEDIENTPIQVTLRVYELDPGQGAVDPSREATGGDLSGHYTECQSIVNLYDATGPSFLNCPGPLTIECDGEMDDLSIYGSPTASDNCGFTMDSTFSIDIAQCGIGTITRTWTATDAYGSTSECVQTITIENNQELTESHIQWPDNYNIYECGASTDIEDLPEAYQGPIVNWGGCGSISINHTDALFNIVPGACYKLLRTWTVIDWCTYNTENPSGDEGRFTHIQEIKVLDDVDPEITCPEPVTVSVSDDCATGVAVLGLPTAEDCSTQITFTNTSPFANSNGADASGSYPLGTTEVLYYANDGCNNNAACTTSVTVIEDEAPNVACIQSFSATLMPLPTGGATVSIPAASFVVSSDDNCTPTNLLKYTANRPNDGTVGVPTLTDVFFDCYDAGSAAVVQVWATDLQGNSTFCTTVVTIQDNGNHCDGQTQEDDGMIAGGVITEDGEDVESVMINISGDNQNMVYTGIDGGFMFEDLPLGYDYSLIAQNNEDMLNGVSTLDLILIGKHILGIQLLSSPYKMIAADVDRSGHISTLDIIKLRKMILHIDEQFPNGNTSWRFVDAAYVFPDPTNPFSSYFPEIFNVNNLDGSEMHADFIGVKIGDVNGSATPNSFTGGDDTDNRNSTPLNINVTNKDIQAGDVFEVAFEAEYMNEWMGYQFTLEFDPELIELEEILSADLPNVYPEENFHIVEKTPGVINVIWNEYGEGGSNGKSTLFSLVCKAKKNAAVKEMFYMSSRMTKAEAYTQDGVQNPTTLNFINAEAIQEVSSSFELFQNRPNPWTNETIIPFQLDPGGQASLSIYDMAGKLVYHVADNYSEGYHEINISRDDLPAIGLFYYTLESGTQKATKKMVLMD